ncbi:MAG: 50S ribosomal protein L10 [Vampirovibrionales bacterium]|nr:50S ribosomal protein L10 [Vampirovibrionales bacterium]
MTALLKKTRADKDNEISELKSSLSAMTVAVVADYRGLTVKDLTDLRAELYKHNAVFTVSKNTLVIRAASGTDAEAMTSFLKGPTALLLGKGDQVQPVKVLKEFLKKNKKDNEIRGGFMEGKPLSAGEVDALAQLPSLDELRGKLLGCIASPANGLVAALSSPQRGLVNVLDQYAKTKQSA